MHASESGEVFNRQLFQELCMEANLVTDAQRARAVGVHQSTIYRVQSGEQRPSLSFANECRRLFGLEAYVQLFPLSEKESTDAHS